MFNALRKGDFRDTPGLWSSMLRDRASQFIDRHGWPLEKDECGYEIDQFDDDAAIYCTISERQKHEASVRLRPVAADSMTEMYFGDLWREAGGDFSSSMEITRLCSSPDLPFRRRRDAMSDLMLGACRFAMKRQMFSIIGVVYAPVARLLVKTGCPTETLASEKTPEGELVLARWTPDECAIWEIQERRARREDIERETPVELPLAA